jgi:flagellar biosynthesis/type III secretory pathway protein FliH
MTRIYQFAVVKQASVLDAEAAEAAEVEAASQVKSDAELEAEQIIADAQADAEAIRQEAANEVQAAASKDVAKLLTGFHRALAVSEIEIAAIVAASVKKIIGTLPADKKAQAIVRTALQEFRSGRQVVMRVAPADRADGSFGKLLALPEFSEVIETVLSDNSLDAGQCVLEVRGARVHVGLDQQVEALEHAMSQALSHSNRH